MESLSVEEKALSDPKTICFTTHNHITGSFTSCNNCSDVSDVSSSTMVCLRSIPSFMLPKELLYFLTGYLARIASITILKELSTSASNDLTPAVGDYLAVISFVDTSSIPHFLSDFSQRPLSTLQPTSADISHVISPPSPPLVHPSSDTSCPVCLEPLCSNFYSLFCGHAFHFNCVQKLESERCPVCRYEHEEMSDEVFCEICHNSNGDVQNGDSNLWICLVCGFCGCGSGSSNHSREHYLTTLHAYAINSSSRRVWDYAGEGYVHRLILRPKIVEVTDPRHSSEMRSVVAPLTAQQEEQLLSRKLEDTAKHYSGVFAWQLEQQREYFEGQLASLRSIITEANDAAKREVVVTADLLKSLEKERSKLTKQCEAARVRLRSAQEEASLLVTLNQSLEVGAIEWQDAVAKAEKELEAEEVLYRTEIPKLEKKVRHLMSRLDQSEEAKAPESVDQEKSDR